MCVKHSINRDPCFSLFQGWSQPFTFLSQFAFKDNNVEFHEYHKFHVALKKLNVRLPFIPSTDLFIKCFAAAIEICIKIEFWDMERWTKQWNLKDILNAA